MLIFMFLETYRLHWELVGGFFHDAAEMLQPNGEVHVSHKTSKPFCDWNIEELALRNFLKLLDCVNFNIQDYEGYANKRGDGKKADDPFPLGECCTFKFVQLNSGPELSPYGPRKNNSRLGWLISYTQYLWLFQG